MIRLATEKDIPGMVALARAMHAESRYRVLPWDGDKVAGLVDWLIGNPDGLALVAEENDEPIGGFLGIITPHFCSAALVAQDYGLFVSPDKRGAFIGVQLLNAFTDWARGKGAVMTTVGVTTGIKHEATARLFNSVGYVEVGQLYEFKENVPCA